MKSIRFEHIGKRYGDVEIIRDLNFDVKAGEFMVFVGPSGCGKSTTLRMLAGLDTMTDGKLYIGDTMVNHLHPKDRNIAMVFQSYALYPHMNVYDNIAFGLQLRKLPQEDIRARVEVAAKTLGLTPLLDRKPKALSGGQRQRVALGRAIVRNPDVFLFDEPLSNLDAELRVQMRAEISQLQRRLKTTTVYVTHDQVEAMTMGHRIAVMRPVSAGSSQKSNLMQCGSPLELYNKPENVFTASFIGTPKMNIIKMRVDEQGECLHGLTTKLPVSEAFRPFIGAYRGKEVIMGIRPEYVLTASNSLSYPKVEGVVEMLEPLGHETIIHIRLGDQIIIGRFNHHQLPEIGATYTMCIQHEEMNLFDPLTEVRLGL